MNDPTLPPASIREFIVASHFNFAKVQEMLAAHPELLNVQYDWGAQGGLENGLQAASHIGNRAIAEFYLSRGVPTSIHTAAMLGNLDEVNAFLQQNPALANAPGVHGISLMFHAALSGSIPLVEALKAAGTTTGYSHALHAAINNHHTEMVRWLLANGAMDVNTPDYQGKMPLDRAFEENLSEVETLLRDHGAQATPAKSS